MAVVNITATVLKGVSMEKSQSVVLPKPSGSGRHSDQLVEELFRGAGWRVRHESKQREGVAGAGVLVRRGKSSYRIAVKMASEGRKDRLIPLWSQASLEAAHAADGKYPPLAIVAAPSISPRVAQQVLDFAAEYAPDVAVGVIDFAGLRRFRGPHLAGFVSADAERASLAYPGRAESADLFSDLNQWMLKVLLAPEVPDRFLAAPRDRYGNASELATAAKVSVMSAFRLVRQLRHRGYLEESGRYLQLVRRNDLFRHWQAAAARRVREVPMRFLLRSDLQVELRRLLQCGVGCLALFAAAEALGVGLVRGVPPHLYVPRLSPATSAAWKGIVPASSGESPDFFLRQPSAPQSIFRGVVRPSGLPVCDLLQVWLDVSAHPARGEEQAELIGRRLLDQLVQGDRVDG